MDFIEGPGGEVAPSDEHRYYPFPMPQVFDGALAVLGRQRLWVRYSDIRQGRIIAHIGNGTAYLDITMMAGRGVTFVKVKMGCSSMYRTRAVEQIRRRFFWELDEWLHSASPKEMVRAHSRARTSYGSRKKTWVPPRAAYKI
jgi:hypothetical protein